MSQMQNQSETKISDNVKSQKTTPGRNVGISKTLLTPCRRLGLPRKIKNTPSSHNQSSPVAELQPSCSPVVVPSLQIQETPLATISSAKSNKSIKSTGKKKRLQKSRANIQSRFPVEEVQKRNNDSSGDSKSFIHLEHQNPSVILKDIRKDINESKEENPNTSVMLKDKHKDINESKENKYCNSEKIKQNQRKFEANGTVQSPVLFESSENNPTKVEQPVKTMVEQKSITKPMQNINNPTVKSAEVLKEKSRTNDFNKASASDGALKKSLSRRLSMKKSLSIQDELTDVDSFHLSETSLSSLFSGEFKKECVVNIENIRSVGEESDEQIKLDSHKLHKKRCILYSSDEEDFVSSQHSVGKKSNSSQDKKDEDWYERIVEIKKRIKKKEKHLEELKQAAVYRKLHNLTELELHIKTWKKCCEDGLLQLLPKLQEHGQMDMQTLMKNLNIPQTISYDIENDCFK